MFIKLQYLTTIRPISISIRCPFCQNLGTFAGVLDVPDLNNNKYKFGHRVCPNPHCLGHVFCVIDTQNHEILRTYPAEKIDFNQEKIPVEIIKSFSEALTCYSEKLYISAAIMIRRTLEELCENKKAVGKSLKERLDALRDNVVMPSQLFDALDHLRLLGNDAAHLEARTYDSIGADEIKIAIDLTKEILKAVYQLEDMVSRMQALRKP